MNTIRTLALCALIPAAYSGSIYIYDAPAFTQRHLYPDGSAWCPATSCDHLRFQMVFDLPMAANREYQNWQPLNWEVSDGVHDFLGAASNLSIWNGVDSLGQFYASTNASGIPSTFDFSVTVPRLGVDGNAFLVASNFDGINHARTMSSQGGVMIAGQPVNPVIGSDAWASTGQGAWAVTHAPEPATWSLLLGGLLLIPWLRRKRLGSVTN
ncbi:MAG: hypothetical protein NVS9B4_00050 [Candidatus Acidiferrum sp.]